MLTDGAVDAGLESEGRVMPAPSKKRKRAGRPKIKGAVDCMQPSTTSLTDQERFGVGGAALAHTQPSEVLDVDADVGGQERTRNRLHRAVDRILDGAGDGDIDAWVRQVLVDIGAFVRAAGPALDYEVGRVLSSVDRPVGDFPGNSAWQGAEISVDRQQPTVWLAAGETARANPPRPAMQQRALAAMLHPIASISCHSWLCDLASALDALRFNEVHAIVTPTPQGFHGYKRGRTMWEIRLLALQWIEFQYHARLMTKTKALGEVALAFDINDLGSIKDWEERARHLLGNACVHEALRISRGIARLYRSARDQLDSGAAKTPALERDLEYCDRIFGREQLAIIARIYKDKPKKGQKKKATRDTSPAFSQRR